MQSVLSNLSIQFNLSMLSILSNLSMLSMLSTDTVYIIFIYMQAYAHYAEQVDSSLSKNQVLIS